MDIHEQIADLATPAANDAGLVVDAVTVSAAGKRSRVLVTVDLPPTEVGSASLDAIAQASRGIGKALDDANVPSTPYTLEVSTPGTDRVLTEPHHFMRARTRKVELDLANGATTTGRLTEADADSLTLDTPDGSTTIALSDVTRGRIVVELKRLDN